MIYRGDRAEAQRQADERAGPCPRCGAKGQVQLVAVSFSDPTFAESGWIAGLVECSQRCDRTLVELVVPEGAGEWVFDSSRLP